MKNETLRKRIADALQKGEHTAFEYQGTGLFMQDSEIRAAAEDAADAVLAVLGLDDFDAAAGRLAESLSRVTGLHPENLHGFAVRALEAALTATGGKHDA